MRAVVAALRSQQAASVTWVPCLIMASPTAARPGKLLVVQTSSDGSGVDHHQPLHSAVTSSGRLRAASFSASVADLQA